MKSINRPTLDEFIQTAKPFLEQDLFSNILSIRLINRIQKGDYPDYHLWTVADDATGQISASVLKTDPHNLILSTGDSESFTALAQYISDAHFPFPGINGPEGSTSAFATAWNALHTNTQEGSPQQKILKPALRLQYYVLDLIEVAGIAAGGPRLADPSDLPLITEWRDDFAVEAGLSKAERHIAPERLIKRIENREVMLWEDGGQPVCMVWGTPITTGIINIGPVYTPRDRRGHRYASACVTEMSRRILTDGHRAVLCADMANPTSNAIYQRIGYREKSIYAEYRF